MCLNFFIFLHCNYYFSLCSTRYRVSVDRIISCNEIWRKLIRKMRTACAVMFFLQCNLCIQVGSVLGQSGVGLANPSWWSWLGWLAPWWCCGRVVASLCFIIYYACACVSACMCVFMWVYVCVFVCVRIVICLAASLIGYMMLYCGTTESIFTATLVVAACCMLLLLFLLLSCRLFVLFVRAALYFD